MFLFIDNYDSFSWNLVQAFYSLGRKPEVYTNDDPRILELATSPDLEAVCISPGPSNPQNAGLCLEFLSRLPKHIPVLGVCLGHQILGYFAGAEVKRGPQVMHGKSSEIIHDGNGLFTGLPNPFTVGRYHSLVVEAQEDHSNPLFTVTSRGPEHEVMSLSYNDRPWVGIQFHPESILTPDGLQLLGNFPDQILPKEEQGKRISEILDILANGKDLSETMASAAFADLMDGRMSPAQAGAFLLGLRAKGTTPLEMATAVSIALGRARKVAGIEGPFIDIVGTGGDGRHSFNCSTASSLILAGMGYDVMKHGNRAVSSSSGSADVLEGIGFPVASDPEEAKQLLRERHFAFLFAPQYHPAFRNVGPIRRELGIRTLFNLLGPLINPAHPTHILLGVAKPEHLELMAQTLLHSSHMTKGAVVHGAGGYDEVTPIGISQVILIENGSLSTMEINPADYGIRACTPEDLAVASKAEAVEVLKRILEGKGPQPMMDMVILNVALAIFLLEGDTDMTSCIRQAREAVYSGVGRRTVYAS